MIVSTHYAPLHPPYPVIYSNGEVAMQIATLITVEGLEEPPADAPRRLSHMNFPTMMPYRIRTHSHPVVSYGNKQAGTFTASMEPNDWSEGIVWDHVELRDVTTLAHVYFEADGSTELNVATRLITLATQERLHDMLNGQQRFSMTKVLHSLKRIMPTNLILNHFKTAGSLFLLKGGLRPGESSIISNHNFVPGLSIAVKQEDTLEATLEAVKMQVEDYLNAISANREQVRIEFKYRDEELRPLIDSLNAIYFNHTA